MLTICDLAKIAPNLRRACKIANLCRQYEVENHIFHSKAMLAAAALANRAKELKPPPLQFLLQPLQNYTN